MRCISIVDPYHNGPLTGLGTGSLSPEQSNRVRPILPTRLPDSRGNGVGTSPREAQVPSCAVRTTQEWREGPHARDSGLVDGDHHVAPARVDVRSSVPVLHERQRRNPIQPIFPSRTFAWWTCAT